MPKRRRFEIVYGHRAVWINDATGCLGRLGVHGIDVHSTIENQVAGAPQCLFCTHGTVGPTDWPKFIDAMLEFHRIDIRSQPLPVWLGGRAV